MDLQLQANLIFVALQGGNLLVLSVFARPNDTRAIKAGGGKFIVARRPGNSADGAVVRVLQDRFAHPPSPIVAPYPAIMPSAPPWTPGRNFHTHHRGWPACGMHSKAWVRCPCTRSDQRHMILDV